MNTLAPRGHNSAGMKVSVTVRAFNSITKYCDKNKLNQELEYPAGATLEDIVSDFKVPLSELYLILVNGRDVSPGLIGDLHLSHELEDGDVIALSGPAPYSYAYGAPVV